MHIKSTTLFHLLTKKKMYEMTGTEHTNKINIKFVAQPEILNEIMDEWKKNLSAALI